MTLNDAGIESSLVDVRKAYRVLRAYHRRIRDIVELISKHFPDLPCSAHDFEVGPISSRKAPLGNWWTWDCTPTIGWDFLFFSRDLADAKKSAKPKFMMALEFHPDSAFNDSEEMDPDPEKFAPAEACESTVDISLTVALEAGVVNWPAQWRNTTFNDNEGVVEVLEGSGQKFAGVWREQPVSAFRDAETVISLVNNFREFAMPALEKFQREHRPT